MRVELMSRDGAYLVTGMEPVVRVHGKRITGKVLEADDEYGMVVYESKDGARHRLNGGDLDVEIQMRQRP